MTKKTITGDAQSNLYWPVEWEQPFPDLPSDLAGAFREVLHAAWLANRLRELVGCRRLDDEHIKELSKARLSFDALYQLTGNARKLFKAVESKLRKGTPHNCAHAKALAFADRVRQESGISAAETKLSLRGQWQAIQKRMANVRAEDGAAITERMKTEAFTAAALDQEPCVTRSSFGFTYASIREKTGVKDPRSWKRFAKIAKVKLAAPNKRGHRFTIAEVMRLLQAFIDHSDEAIVRATCQAALRDLQKDCKTGN